jgi:hypothetical protein
VCELRSDLQHIHDPAAERVLARAGRDMESESAKQCAWPKDALNNTAELSSREKKAAMAFSNARPKSKDLGSPSPASRPDTDTGSSSGSAGTARSVCSYRSRAASPPSAMPTR